MALTKSEEGFRGKKAVQVAEIIKKMQAEPDKLHNLEELCLSVGQKYTQDVVAAFMALEMTGLIDVYKEGKTQAVKWEGPPDPTIASAEH